MPEEKFEKAEKIRKLERSRKVEKRKKDEIKEFFEKKNSEKKEIIKKTSSKSKVKRKTKKSKKAGSKTKKKKGKKKSSSKKSGMSGSGKSRISWDPVVDKAIEYCKKTPYKVTVRQIFYHLVSSHILPNAKYYYENLSKKLVEARESGKLGFDEIEDRTRTIENYAATYYMSPEEHFEYELEDFLNSEYTIPKNLYQKDLVIINLEKQALESVFRQVIPKQSNVIFLVGKGFNSVTQLYNLSELIKNHFPNKDVYLYIFSDWDKSGRKIEKNVIDKLKQYGVKFKKTERIALTKEQVKKYNLQPNMIAESDKGEGYELDALDPMVLQDLVKKVVEKHWDKKAEEEVKKLEKILQKRYNKKMEKVKEAVRKVVEPKEKTMESKEEQEPEYDFENYDDDLSF